MDGTNTINKNLLVKNTVLSFIGQITPLIAAVFTIPFIIKSLGIDRFGILSLAWMILGYLALFDLGLGRATTKFVAEAIGKGTHEEIPHLVWRASAVQLLFGLSGAVILVIFTPFIVSSIFKIPAELADEARLVFYFIAAAVPVTMISSSYSGALEASQRFDLINIVKIPVAVSVFVLPVVGILSGMSLAGIVLLILAARLIGLAAFIRFYLKIFPHSKKSKPGRGIYSKLFSFGGWVTVCNIVIPAFIYMDRFLIGAIISVGALAYYAAPYEMLTRLLIIPASIMAVVFPAFSNLSSKGARHEIDYIFSRSTKYIITAMVPITIIFLLCAGTILSAWLGSTFSKESEGVAKILSVAILLNAVGYVPFALIQGVGRPDITAKYHMIELPVYIAAAFFLIKAFGINGAAFAWCLRMCWTIPVFFILCARVAKISSGSLFENKLAQAFYLAGGAVIAALVISAVPGMKLPARSGLSTAVLLAIYVISAWFYTFDENDKKLAKGFLADFYNPKRRAK